MIYRRNVLTRNLSVFFLILLAGWILLNLIQAIFTEVLSDEAYYRFYGQNMGLGFFDHPPVVAIMTRLSSLIFKGNLGIRFFTVLLQPVTIVLVISFIILSNLKLLESWKFWMAALTALFLFLPHICWQVVNNFPSLKFHLIDRAQGFSWNHIVEYLPNQIAAFNPLIFGYIIYLMSRKRMDDIFDGGLVFIVGGFILFFWLAAVRGHVEPQWTIAAAIPTVILLYNECCETIRVRRCLCKALIPVIILIFIARILLFTELDFVKDLGFAGKRQKYESIGSAAGDLPVIFPGSYQDPSLYSYFTGKEAMPIGTMFTRKTEYDLVHPESELQNKAAFIYGYAEGKSREFNKGEIKFFGYITDSLQTVNRMMIKTGKCPRRAHPGDTINVSLVIRNPYGCDIDFSHRQFPVSFRLAFICGKKIGLYPAAPDVPVDRIAVGGCICRRFAIIIPDLPPALYLFGICLETPLGPEMNDSFAAVRIERD